MLACSEPFLCMQYDHSVALLLMKGTSSEGKKILDRKGALWGIELAERGARWRRGPEAGKAYDSWAETTRHSSSALPPRFVRSLYKTMSWAPAETDRKCIRRNLFLLRRLLLPSKHTLFLCERYECIWAKKILLTKVYIHFHACTNSNHGFPRSCRGFVGNR